MIFGASTRAAAQSAVRADFRPLCADRFADEDLREIAEIVPLADYPDGLPQLAANSPPLPWIYTGALENRPGLLAKLERIRPLWGNSAEVVRRVRNPFLIFDVLKRAELPALAARESDSPPPADGQWMRKPMFGSAGRGIRIWDKSNQICAESGEPCYFQARSSGQPISALFLATGETTVLIGASEQLIGLPALSASPFGYCGSIGPIGLSDVARRQIGWTGTVIASEFGLSGLFGIDFLLDQGVAWPTEVNPRYTASVEVYEWVWEVPLLEWHSRACAALKRTQDSPAVGQQLEAVLHTVGSQRPGRQAAKAVIYAPFSLRAPDLVAMGQSPKFAAAGVQIADRPIAGSPIIEKEPVCTLIMKWASPAGFAAFQSCLAVLAVTLERNRVGN
jgi:predicted ATP-grasp superfamily ATP-dependent carboligase